MYVQYLMGYKSCTPTTITAMHGCILAMTFTGASFGYIVCVCAWGRVGMLEGRVGEREVVTFEHTYKSAWCFMNCWL